MDPEDPRAEFIRARIRGDLLRLPPAARWRYRAALRHLMREAEKEATPPPVARPEPRFEIAVAMSMGVAAGVWALGLSPNATLGVATAVLGLSTLWVLAEAATARPVVPWRPEPQDPAARALSLHLAALAQSRREYYGAALSA